MKTPPSSTSLSPRLYLGTMTFGWSQSSSKVDDKVAYQMVEKFVTAQQQSHQHQDQPTFHIDTARIYSNGKSETILGHIIKQWNNHNHHNMKFGIGTKAHPSQPNGLSKSGIEQQWNASIECLGSDNLSSYMNEYYLHQPDPNHPLYDSLVCLNEYCHNDMIGMIGMSNYHVQEVQHAYQLCEQHNLDHPPKVYQGLYNPLNRLVEDELIPFLHSNDCSFIAYNPLAGGLLVDHKHVMTNDDSNNNALPPEKPLKGRFYKNPNYIPRFYTEPNFQAVSLIQNVCNEYDITMIEATYRWLMYHSALRSNDGILIGASSLSQLQQNMKICCTTYPEPLPDRILQVFDQAWEITRPTAFPYWRSYSSDMPNREQLDHGASYDATTGKK